MWEVFLMSSLIYDLDVLGGASNVLYSYYIVDILTGAWFGDLGCWIELHPIHGKNYTYQCFFLVWDC